MQRDSKHLLLIIISSCLQQSFSDPCMFLRLSWSSDHGKEDSFCDEYLCSIQSPEVSWCLKRSHDVSHLQQSESQRLLLQCSLLRHRLNPLHVCQDLHQPQQEYGLHLLYRYRRYKLSRFRQVFPLVNQHLKYEPWVVPPFKYCRNSYCRHNNALSRFMSKPREKIQANCGISPVSVCA